MSLKDCIDAAVGAGEMEGGRAGLARELYDELDGEYRGRMNHGEAARQAAADTLIVVKRVALEKKRQLLLQTRATRQITVDMAGYRTIRGEEDPGAAMAAMLDRDNVATYSNVEARRKAILGRYHARLDEVMATFRRDIVGAQRNKATMRNVVAEAFGEKTKDPFAKQLAKAWAEAAEMARLRFNAAGGRIPKRADWGLPQMHDTLAVRRASFDEWRDFALPRLDRGKMIDELTGLPFSAERLEIALREVYETIRTDGFNKFSPSGNGGGKKLASRHSDHRFLVFRDGDNWLEYQERFGSPEPFTVMMAHLDRMARDTALIEVLGPNPAATMRWMGETVAKRAAELDAAEGATRHMDRAGRRIKLSEDMYGHLTGATTAPIDGTVSRSFAGLRSILQSAQLGAAAISAVTDINFQRIARAHAGIPQARDIGRLVKLLNPANLEDQKLAVRLGLIAENWSSVGLAQARYVGEVSGPEVSRRVADFVLRVSGLSPWTQAGRWAFGMEFLGHLGDQVGRTFDELPEATGKTLRNYGIRAADWDVIRATELYEHGGATFLRPDDLAVRADLEPSLANGLADRMLEMIQSETEFAVPSSSVRGRAMFISDSRPGTIQGELMRSVAMYKNFAITLAATHVSRGLGQRTLAAKGRYFADLLVSTTIMGALALQLKEISKGRDPRPMEDPALWSAALLQGGGLGIFGDFLFSDVNRFDRGLAETVAGPVVGFFNDIRRLTLGNLAQLPGEDPTNIGREVTHFLRRYTPGGSVWYARLGYERLVLDQIQAMADPKAAKARRRTERRYRRDFGQRFWWRPGKASPARAPNLSNALEQRP